MAHEIYIPKMSDHMETGRVVRWLVKEGEAVKRGQILLEIETDKAVGEIEAPGDGVIRGIRAAEGADVPVGAIVAYLLAPHEALPPVAPARPLLETQANEPGATRVGPSFDAAGQAALAGAGPVIFATPVARKMAKQYGIDLSQIQGSGPHGRVKREDLEAYLEARQPSAPPSPVADPQPGPVLEAVEDGHLSHIQRITGQRMLESVTTAPHFSLQVTADMHNTLAALEAINRRVEQSGGSRVSVTAWMVRVAGAAIQKHPRINAQYHDGNLRLFAEINVGVAIGNEQGLVVPVIRNADKKMLAEINRELKQYQVLAEQMRFSPQDLEGGTFTISNLGMAGIDAFTAIINPPQSAILAVGRIHKVPVAQEDNSVVVRPVATFTLSVDHRVLDGWQAARFLVEIKDLVESPALLL